MSSESKLQLDLLVYKIVLLRIICGNYDNSATTRNILEVQTRTRLRRLGELENTNEHEVGQKLYDSYIEKLRSRSASLSISVRAPRPSAAMPAI